MPLRLLRPALHYIPPGCYLESPQPLSLFWLCQEKELRANEARVVEARGQLATAKEDHEKLSSHFYSLNAKHEAIIVRPPSPCAACMAAPPGHVPCWSNQLERAQHSMDGVLVTCLVCTLLCRRSEMVSCRSSNP